MASETLLSVRNIPKNLLRPGVLYAYGYVAFSFAIILALIYAGAMINGVLPAILFYILIGLFQYRLSIVLHDCVHYSLFESKTANILVGDLAAAMLFTTFTNFRVGHYAHHKFYRTGDDPSLPDYTVIPKSKWDVIWFMLQPLVGYAVFVKLAQFADVQSGKTSKQADGRSGSDSLSGRTPLTELIIMGLVQVLLFALASRGFAEPLRSAYLVFFPAATIVLFLSRVRTFLEHGGLNEDHHDEEAPPRNCGRNTISAMVERFILSPMNFNYHFWHHKYPSIPSSNLPGLHQWYLDNHPEFFEDEEHEEVHADTFFATLRQFLATLD